MRNERGARVARGSAIAAFATFTASLAHTLGGGMPPGLLTVALALAFSVPFAIAIAGRRAGTVRAGIAAVGAQLVLHGLYSLGPAGAASPVTMTDASAGAMHVHSTTHVQLTQTAPALLNDAAAAHSHPAAWMWATHTLAAVLTIAFIASTDRVLATIRAALTASVRGIRLAWALLLAPVAEWPAEHSRRPEASALRLARTLHLLAAPHRGPPMVTPAA